MNTSLIPATEAAATLGITRRTLQHWSSTGKFPRPAYIGRRAYYLRSDIDAHIEKAVTNR